VWFSLPCDAWGVNGRAARAGLLRALLLLIDVQGASSNEMCDRPYECHLIVNLAVYLGFF
jgi:hypothetical protein